jgi:hypothetical protein
MPKKKRGGFLFVLRLYRCCKPPSLTFEGKILWDAKQAGHGVGHAIPSNRAVSNAWNSSSFLRTNPCLSAKIFYL